jgi:hypothetical protein
MRKRKNRNGMIKYIDNTNRYKHLISLEEGRKMPIFDKNSHAVELLAFIFLLNQNHLKALFLTLLLAFSCLPILVNWDSCNKDSQAGYLEITEIYFSQFWRLEVQDQGASNGFNI